MPGRPCCRQGASRSWRGEQSGELYYLGRRFLTAAHVVPKRLLVVRELKSKVGVPSEPCTELIPSFFGLEM